MYMKKVQVFGIRYNRLILITINEPKYFLSTPCLDAHETNKQLSCKNFFQQYCK